MFFEAERALTKGYLAWFRGELDLAVSCLERVLALRPGAPDALYPLARALSEKNDLSRALSLLDEAALCDPGGESRVFRALLHYDHGGFEAGKKEISHAHPRNHLARTLAALLDFKLDGAREGRETKGSGTITLPAAAPWIPDAAGRVLALLEERFHAAGAGEALQLHHLLLAPEAPPSLKPASPATRKASPFHRKAWETLLEEAFAERRYEDVEGLFARKDLRQAWISLPANIYRAFSLLVMGNEGKTAGFLAQLLKAHPASADLHFLEGLRHAWRGRGKEAGWSFARAARLADAKKDYITEFVLVHLMDELCRKLGIELRLED